ncbi:hypothetical protein OF83DRAFT_150315 [Amylostereum chailletii]|nr:hypothetical protein OF83DRAFT_150315 [Amylostereum chailletii]
MFSLSISTSHRTFVAAALRVMQRIDTKVKPEEYMGVKAFSTPGEDLLTVSAECHVPSAPLLIQAPFEETGDFVPVVSPVPFSQPFVDTLQTVVEVHSDLADVRNPLEVISGNIGLGIDTKTSSALGEVPVECPIPNAPHLVQIPFEENKDLLPVISPAHANATPFIDVPDIVDDVDSNMSKVSKHLEETPRNIGLGLIMDMPSPSVSCDCFSFGHFFQSNLSGKYEDEDEYDDEDPCDITSTSSLFLDHFSTGIDEDHKDEHNLSDCIVSSRWMSTVTLRKLPTSTLSAPIASNVTTVVVAHTLEAQRAIVDVIVPTVLVGPPYGSSTSIDACENVSLLEPPKALSDASSRSSASSSLFSSPPSSLFSASPPAMFSVSSVFSAHSSRKHVLRTPKTSLAADVRMWMKRALRRRV